MPDVGDSGFFILSGREVIFMTEEQKLVKRAEKAYFKSGANQQPANTSGISTHGGKEYVVLENVNGILAVYRILNDERLRRLKRWPKEFD